MSVANFKATLWEGALLANFHSVSVADAVSIKPTEIQGNKVIFNRVGAGTIKDYEGTIAPRTGLWGRGADQKGKGPVEL